MREGLSSCIFIKALMIKPEDCFLALSILLEPFFPGTGQSWDLRDGSEPEDVCHLMTSPPENREGS